MGDSDDDPRQSQEILVFFWGVLVVLLLCLFFGVLYSHYRTNRLVQKRLYNFKRAPRTYVDEDSFVNLREQ